MAPTASRSTGAAKPERSRPAPFPPVAVALPPGVPFGGVETPLPPSPASPLVRLTTPRISRSPPAVIMITPGAAPAAPLAGASLVLTPLPPFPPLPAVMLEDSRRRLPSQSRKREAPARPLRPVGMLSAGRAGVAGETLMVLPLTWHCQLEAEAGCSENPGWVAGADDGRPEWFPIRISPELFMVAPVRLHDTWPTIVRSRPESLGLAQLLSMVPVIVTAPVTRSVSPAQGPRRTPLMTRSWLTLSLRAAVVTVTPAGMVTER